MNFFGIFSILSILLNLNKIPVPETKMVINIFRHGARTPKHYIEEIEPIFNKYPLGSLTDNGWRMQFLLGKYLKQRLPINFIKGPKDFLLICSYKERTINSGISFASGLVNYMFKITQISNFDKFIGSSVSKGKSKNFSFAEIIFPSDKDSLMYKETFKFPPIKKFIDNLKKFQLMVVSREQDILFHGRNCKFSKSINYMLGRDRNKLFFSDITFEEHKIIYDYLKIEFPLTFRNIKDFKIMTHYDIKNYYLIIKSLELEKPGFVSKMPAEVENSFYKVIYDYYYKKAISSEDQAKVTSSMFFDHLIYFFDKKISGITEENDFKIVSYSGHDYNILGIINNLYGRDYLDKLEKYSNKDFLFSSYSSSFEFHLIKKDFDEYFVRIFYNGKEPNHKFINKNLVYYDRLGVKYLEFKKMIKKQIFPDFRKCFIKSKRSKHFYYNKLLKLMNFMKLK